MKRKILLLAAIMIFMTSCGGQSRFDGNHVKFPLKGEVPVNERTVRFLGRYYAENDVYYTNMSCAGFEVCFEGTELKAELVSVPSDSDHNTYIHVFIDGDYSALEKVETDGTDEGIQNDSRILLAEGRHVVTLASGLEQGRHTVTVQKANQSSLNRLGAVKLLPGDGAVLEPPAPKEKSILVVGDSITCGSNNLGAEDAASYSVAEDGLLTMSAIAARHYHCDIEIFAKNGMAASTLNTMTEGHALYYVDPFNQISEKWDTGRPERQHDLVIINLGINDANQVKGSGGTYTAQQFREEYRKLIRTVRVLYPESYILCTDLSDSAANEKKAVAEYIEETGDEKISFYKRKGAYSRHPLISQHKAEAKELIQQIDQLHIF